MAAEARRQAEIGSGKTMECEGSAAGAFCKYTMPNTLVAENLGFFGYLGSCAAAPAGTEDHSAVFAFEFMRFIFIFRVLDIEHTTSAKRTFHLLHIRLLKTSIRSCFKTRQSRHPGEIRFPNILKDLDSGLRWNDGSGFNKIDSNVNIYMKRETIY